MSDTGFLGIGWSFPPAFEKNLATNAMSRDEQNIRESLEILLTTRTGERIMYPELGCNLHPFLFEELTTQLLTRLSSAVQSAVGQYEPRIQLDNVEAAADPDQPGLIQIQVDYTIIATNTRHNAVYPFYLDEGTALDL